MGLSVVGTLAAISDASFANKRIIQANKTRNCTQRRRFTCAIVPKQGDYLSALDLHTHPLYGGHHTVIGDFYLINGQ